MCRSVPHRPYSLSWGDAWKSVIRSNLGSVAFFIPIITPAYFKSAACRTELEAFAERTAGEGLQGLLLPILWVSSAEFKREHSEDPLVTIVKDRQWVDWTELRHEERGSSAYSRALQRMAERIQRANDEADRSESAGALAVAEIDDVADKDDEDQRLEKLARMEEDIQLWQGDLMTITEGLQEMGDIAKSRTSTFKTDPRANSFAGRLTLVRSLAGELQPAAEKIEHAGADFAAKVSAVDEGVRIIIDSAPAEIAREPQAAIQFSGFFRQLHDLDAIVTLVDIQLTGFVDSVAPLQKLSRDLKKPVEAATGGVTRIKSALGIIQGWSTLINSQGLAVDVDEESGLQNDE